MKQTRYHKLALIIVAFLLTLEMTLFVSCTPDQKVIVGLQPYTGFDSKMTDTISVALETNYKIKVYRLKPLKLPQEAFVNLKTPRYRADKLIAMLKANKSDTLDFIMGLTHSDISFTKRDASGQIKEPKSTYEDWGIFGLGYRPGPSCVISTFRLQHPDQKTYMTRIKKVAIHEMGHNLGLPHCESENCVMRDAVETIKTIDKVFPVICERCKRKI